MKGLPSQSQLYLGLGLPAGQVTQDSDASLKPLASLDYLIVS